jgi:hypothetical protein
MSQFEQRENVKFCQILGKSASETFKMKKQTYGQEALGRSAVSKWHSMDDDEHTGRPRTHRTKLKIQEVASWCVPTAPKR